MRERRKEKRVLTLPYLKKIKKETNKHFKGKKENKI